MADDNTLNDPELSRLERRLAATMPSPTSAERDRLLYGCGQAAGRAQMRRRLHATTAVGAFFACASVGLGYLSLANVGPKTAALPQSGASRPDERTLKSAANTALRSEPENPNDFGRQMTASWTFEQLVNSERDGSSAVADTTFRSSSRVFRAADHPPIDEL